jgi:hypothetical protein
VSIDYHSRVLYSGKRLTNLVDLENDMPVEKNPVKYTRNVIISFILGFILIVLVSLFFGQQKWDFGSIEKFQNNKPDKSTIANDDIKEMTFLFNKNANEIHMIKKEDGNWILYEDSSKLLPQEDIVRMLQLFASIQKKNALPGPVVPGELGLEPPVAQLNLVFSSGDSQLLEIGKVDKSTGKYNIRMDSGQPFQADFETIYGILKTFYLKVLPVVLNGDSQTTKIPESTP